MCDLLNLLRFFTAHQRSCRKVMVSVACLLRGGGRCTEKQLCPPRLVHTCSTWTSVSLYSPNPHPPPDMFKLVHYVAHTFRKRAVGIRLKCFLVFFVFVSLCKYHSSSNSFKPHLPAVCYSSHITSQ